MEYNHRTIKEQISDTYNIDESYRHYFQQMKRDIKDNIPCNSIYIKFKNRQKKKKTDGDRS